MTHEAAEGCAGGEEDGSITLWIEALKRGEPDAAQLLWERYFERLVRMAATRLQGVSGSSAVDGEETAALSAIDSVCRGAAMGRFPRLSDREDLWQVLVMVTARKVCDQIERRRAKRRGGGRVSSPALLETAEAREPSPEFAAMCADECSRLLGMLKDDTYRNVAVWKMEGYTREEIGKRLNCSTRTVADRLEVIRKTWEGECP
ncbi:ECF-type sigma factor [Aquisphaera insulae]|uniref:ECF-type sigma factor n=1 Tax=Aquisphaera insulae TaxID=2712864 RepID=UPI0013EBEA74|nr:ECF-type sigma factor [Aquisphaera insulae]